MKLNALGLIALLLLGCGKKNATIGEPDKKEKTNAKEVLPSSTNQFEFYKSGKDDDHNQMEIYVTKKTVNKDSLRKLCNERKVNFQKINVGIFCLVIFDSSDFAAFPKNPFSAYYGTDDFRMKHIKAFYLFNSTNNFEELNIYKENMLDSAPE